MSISDVNLKSASLIRPIVSTRAQLDDLQRQLGTGKRSDTYAGIGIDRGLTVGLRTQLSGIDSYQNTILQAGVRLQIGQLALTQADTIARTSQSTIVKSSFNLAGGNQTVDQKTSLARLDQLVGLLNTQAGDRYLFSGRAPDQPSVENVDAIINGDGARAGLRQIISERGQADRGADGLGRLAIASPTATSVTLAEDSATSPFGLKLEGVTSALTGATVTGPAGSPQAISVDVTANPAAGETIAFNFTLPDGTSERITLKATASATPATGEFSIGATPDATRANLQTALSSSVATLAATSLTAASAVQAGREFFDTDSANPPQRVGGSPFATATTLVAGSDANTVGWYTGEAGTDPARATATARVDQSLVTSYGLRANEDGLRSAVQNLAVFAAITYSGTDPNAQASYLALTQRTAAGLNGAPGAQKISDIAAELGSAQKLNATANERHQQTKAVLQDFLGGIEDAPKEEVAAQILALQTSLQATLQTTALLLKTNLLQYI